MAVQKPVEVTIMGQKFVVRSESDEAYVREVAAFVDQKMNNVLQKAKGVSNLNVAILSAMNIADEFFSFRKKKEQTFEEVTEKLTAMVSLVEDHL